MKQTERKTEIYTQGVPYEVAIKQLTALSLARLDEKILESAVTKIQKTNELVAQAEKALSEARAVGLDYGARGELLKELEICKDEYAAACFNFTYTLLGQVFAWLEGGKNE